MIAKKKMITLLLSAALCASAAPVFAEEAGTVPEAASVSVETVPTFTIDDAIAYAKENSSSMAALKASEDNAKYLQSESRLSYKNMREVTVRDINSYLLASGYTYRASRFSYRIAQRQTLLGEYTLKSNVEIQFYTYLSNKNKLKLAEDALASAKDRVNYAQIKFDNGIISANDLESFKLAEIEAQNKVNSAKRTMDYSLMQLKSTISYPLDKELNISGSFERRPKLSVTPEQAVEKAKTSLSWANANDQLALAKFKLDKYHGFYGSGTAGWYSASTEYAGAELNYSTTLENATLNIYNTYNQMLTAYETLDYLDRNVRHLDSVLAASKVRYDLGLSSSDEYLSTVQSCNSVKDSLSDAELMAYTTVVQYDLAFNCENTIFELEDDPLL